MKEKASKCRGFLHIFIFKVGDKTQICSYAERDDQHSVNSPCCCGVSCWRRAILADQGWRSLRWWQARRRWRRDPAAGTPFAAQPPAAWGQRPETWEVCHLDTYSIIMQRDPHVVMREDKEGRRTLCSPHWCLVFLYQASMFLYIHSFFKHDCILTLNISR